MGLQVEGEYRGCLRRVDSASGRRSVVWADHMGSSLSTTCLDVIEFEEPTAGAGAGAGRGGVCRQEDEEEEGGEAAQPQESRARGGSFRKQHGHWLVSPLPSMHQTQDPSKGKFSKPPEASTPLNLEASCDGCIIL